MNSRQNLITIPGFNIQFPWSQYLLSGEKTIETRKYPLPKKYLGKQLAIVETPGKTKPTFRARIVGIVTFSHSIEYKSFSQWIADQSKHQVPSNDPIYQYKSTEKKYGWIVSTVTAYKDPIAAPKSRGIIFASSCKVPSIP